MSNSFAKLEQAIKMYATGKAVKLVNKTDDINAANHKGQTALALAANRGQLDVVKACLKRGAAVDSRDQWKQTPLMRAAYNSHEDVVKLLLKHGADIHAKNTNDKSPVLYAAENGDLETLKILVQHGADVDDLDTADTSALIYATFQDEDNLDMVKYISKRCSNKNTRDWQGKNALDYALENGYKAKAEFLKKEGLEQGNAEEIDRIEKEKNLTMVKNIQCLYCGAPKMTAYTTPYVYCDFCASFMDYDYHLAQKLSPTPEIDEKTKEARAYNRWNSRYSIIDFLTYPEWDRIVKEAPECTSGDDGKRIFDVAVKHNIGFDYQAYFAQGTGDAELFADVKVRETEYQIEHHPAHFSPKIQQASYRDALLTFIKNSNRAIISDPEIKKVYDEIILRQFDILYNEYYADSTGFWIYFDHYKHFLESWAAKLDRENIFPQHPDAVKAEQFLRLEESVFLQKWLDCLEEKDVRKALELTDKLEAYRVLEPASLFFIHCGICGTEMGITEASTKVVCETCGTVTNARKRDITCPSCAYTILFPVDKDSISCPACSTIVSLL